METQDETSPRTGWVSVILFAFLFLWLGIGTILWHIGLPEFVLWNVLMILILVITVIASVSLLRPNTMTLSTFLGAIDRLDAGPAGTFTHGIGGSHLVINFPPRFARGYILPLPSLNIPLRPINALSMKMEKNGEKEGLPETPVTGIVEITMELPADLKRLQLLARKINLLSARDRDLAILEPVVFYEHDYTTGTMKEDPRQCFRIVEVLQRVFQPAIDEAFSQTAKKFSLTSLLATDPEVEKEFKKRLRENDNIIRRSGLLADELFMFDANLMDIVPSDPETAMAISAETKELYIARGVIKKAEGEAKAIKIKAEAARAPGGHIVLANETLRIIGESGKATIVATPDVLNAVAATLLKPAPEAPKNTEQPKK